LVKIPMSDTPSRPARLLEQVALCCQRRHYSKRTAEAYVYWARRFAVFHGKRHPKELGEAHVREFLDSLVRRCVAATTHSQALCALVFLYRHVLEQSFGWLESLERPKRPSRMPVVLTSVARRSG